MSERTQGYKQRAAERAAELIESGMVVGLGTGSTAILAVRRLAQRLESGELTDLVGVPTSEATAAEARKLGIPLTTLDDRPTVDLTIDGADEVDPRLDLIKGGGGALLREKIVAQASARVIIVVDEGKLSPVLGTKWAVPIEVVPFGLRTEALFLEELGATVEPRLAGNGDYFLSDSGNKILDANFGPIEDAQELAWLLEERAAIVTHGLFLGLATEVIVAGPDGLRELKPEDDE
ncbi:MAG: ribose-5-phosphate isomerase RpiA [Gemmatimonadetes bacterium]|uniref:Ribose-5-phosphate isomerase A n=1 Tax=Candidatus Kutchimonas denitrificans TaxID=3056748 RepID=A0AAE4ZDJ5_9BACT|nr:ribose-5-phosphate isomerase RpiA [Gemmatimonadota bacterium]NIR76525.1 ribose-5-phosphate isomerase RpiA [Candidatus Kutchimonas denitrificans]NIS03343.1 ribose-5-phosphate isomerase RpiA [Gemmatimonadota bacterium]NIT69204.1 ribose-5-phosphate isomerase RpiA [Gemmatimonadota bacterium]NIU54596.1 ribose-5-phosphate isomerase RpiA [Gemmatimonadota bacterium]